jgi:hypothetical protein
MGKRKFGRMAASVAVDGTRRSRSIGFTQSLIEDHAADDLAEP